MSLETIEALLSVRGDVGQPLAELKRLGMGFNEVAEKGNRVGGGLKSAIEGAVGALTRFNFAVGGIQMGLEVVRGGIALFNGLWDAIAGPGDAEIAAFRSVVADVVKLNQLQIDKMAGGFQRNVTALGLTEADIHVVEQASVALEKYGVTQQELLNIIRSGNTAALADFGIALADTGDKAENARRIFVELDRIGNQTAGTHERTRQGFLELNTAMSSQFDVVDKMIDGWRDLGFSVERSNEALRDAIRANREFWSEDAQRPRTSPAPTAGTGGMNPIAFVGPRQTPRGRGGGRSGARPLGYDDLVRGRGWTPRPLYEAGSYYGTNVAEVEGLGGPGITPRSTGGLMDAEEVFSFTDDRAAKFEERMEKWRSSLKGTGALYSTFTDSLTAGLDAAITGEQKMGKAMLARAAQGLKARAIEATIESAWNFAKAAGAAMNPATAALAPGYATEGAKMAGVAALAAAGAAALGQGLGGFGGGNGGGGGGSAVAGGFGGGGRGYVDQRPLVINIHGAEYSNKRQLGEMLVGAMDDYLSRRN